MANEYRLVLPKTPQGGFAESPEQAVGNAGSPLLDQSLTIQNGIAIGVAVMYGKKIANAGYQAIVGQLGNSRLEEAIAIGGKILTYAGIIIGGGPTGIIVAAAGATAEVATIGITAAVEGHAIALENERIRETRGTRINYNAGGYYG